MSAGRIKAGDPGWTAIQRRTLEVPALSAGSNFVSIVAATRYFPIGAENKARFVERESALRRRPNRGYPRSKNSRVRSRDYLRKQKDTYLLGIRLPVLTACRLGLCIQRFKFLA